MSKTRQRSKRSRLKVTHDFDKLAALIVSESDRVAVIICVSMIDDMLGGVLAAYFNTTCTASANDDMIACRKFLLYDKMAPLGNSGVRSEACFALGLIDDRIHRLLETLRLVRNDAAHLADAFQFENGYICKIWAEFSGSEKQAIAKMWGRPKSISASGLELEVSDRELFQFASLWVYGALLQIALKPREAATILANDKWLIEAAEFVYESRFGSSRDAS